jgi:hypothetical protein
MYPDYLVKAGVIPKLEPAWGVSLPAGYDVLTTAYSYDEIKIILTYAKQDLEKNGLGTPKSYRAGGWFANLDTLRALADSGFLVDSSGRTEYKLGNNNMSGNWSLKSTSQPYFPSSVNQNSDVPPPNLPILEIPNNGADDYSFSSAEMIERFNDNYSGGVIEKAIVVTYLSHPQWFDEKRQKTMADVFAFIDSYSYDKDLGPVIYSTLISVYQDLSGNNSYE